MKYNKIISIDFTIHDLRRTFITIAGSLHISAYALKRLPNHKMQNDVTLGYLIIDVERLRKPMQQITETLLKCLEVKEDNHRIKETMNQVKHWKNMELRLNV